MLSECTRSLIFYGYPRTGSSSSRRNPWKHVSDGHLAGAVAVTFSTLAVVFCFIAVPMLFGQLDNMRARTANNMALYKRDYERLWSEIQVIQSQLRPKRQSAAFTDARQNSDIQFPPGFIPFPFRDYQWANGKRNSSYRHGWNPTERASKTTLPFIINDYRPPSKAVYADNRMLATDKAKLRVFKSKLSDVVTSYGTIERSYPVFQLDSNAVQCQGPPGAPGLDGTDGEDGQDGIPGKDGDMISELISDDECEICPFGPPGAPGEIGPQGIQGEKGPPGIPGHRGADGEMNFEPGPQGDQGPTGTPGTPGVAGLIGDEIISGIGEPGLPGPPGSPGLIGPAGQPGTAALAENGPTGLPGLKGDPGAPGPPGEMGEQGEQGIPGVDTDYCSCPRRTQHEKYTFFGPPAYPRLLERMPEVDFAAKERHFGRSSASSSSSPSSSKSSYENL